MNQSHNIHPVTFAVTLRSGGDFIPENAIALAAQVRKNFKIPHEFVCYTDTPINHELVTERPLQNPYPGFWSVLEMFTNKGPTVVTGLDTIVPGDISKLGELALTCPRETIYMSRPRHPRMLKYGFWASGIMIWNGDWSWVYDEFDYEKETKIWRWEQEYTSNLFKQRGTDVRVIQNYIDGWYLYKDLVRAGIDHKCPDDARIVVFSGKPRPHMCDKKWVRNIYNTYLTWKYTIPFEEIHHEIYGADEADPAPSQEDVFDNKSEA